MKWIVRYAPAEDVRLDMTVEADNVVEAVTVARCNMAAATGGAKFGIADIRSVIRIG